jgi:hypothetical protein
MTEAATTERKVAAALPLKLQGQTDRERGIKYMMVNNN